LLGVVQHLFTAHWHACGHWIGRQLSSAEQLQQELVTGTCGGLVGQLACCLPASAAGHGAACIAGQLVRHASRWGLVVLVLAVRIAGVLCGG
jgi:hypothetical protein